MCTVIYIVCANLLPCFYHSLRCLGEHIGSSSIHHLESLDIVMGEQRLPLNKKGLPRPLRLLQFISIAIAFHTHSKIEKKGILT